MNFRNRQRALRSLVAAILVLTGLTIGARAQGPQGGPQGGLTPIRFSGKAEPAQVAPGERARIVLTATIDPEWHLYSLTQPAGGPRPTRISIDGDGPVSLIGTPRQPRPRIAPDPNFSTPGQPPFMTETFENRADFTLDVEVRPNAPLGPQKVIIKVGFQACDDHQCLPPRTRPVEVDLTISAARGGQSTDPIVAMLNRTGTKTPESTAESTPESGAATAGEAPAQPAKDGTAPDNAKLGASRFGQLGNEDRGPDPRSRGLLGYILFAMGVGFISLLTPCVFPMIPITVSFFTKREKRTTGEAVKQALIYCFGIIFTFTGLGLALTLIAGPAGINRVAASPLMNIFLTALFVVFALNLLGLFEIQLPSWLLNRLDARAQAGTTTATLLMGLTFTLTSFTCTAAFVGTVLVAVTQGEWFWPAVGMLSFSTAFALPFFLLALFPKYLQSLPKSGGWMNSVKVVMGFVELGAAFKFLSNVDLVLGWNTVSRNLVLAAWIAISLVTALYLLGKFLLPHDSEVARLSVGRMLVATFFLGLAFYFMTGLLGGSLGEWEAMLPPPPKNAARIDARMDSGAGAANVVWLEGYDAALETARRERKPVFLNFTGVTCTNCRWMESNMFPDPEIRRELDKFVRVELYTDRETPEDQRNGELQAEKFQSVALPLYAIVDPEGTALASFPGLTRDRTEFLAFIRRGAARFTTSPKSQTEGL